jgi:hypothetical protein
VRQFGHLPRIAVSKLEDDRTVTAKIVSRDEAISPDMLTDRMFEPGGEKYMQGLKVRKKNSSSHNTDSAV